MDTISRRLLPGLLIVGILAGAARARGQDSLQFYRLYLRDKGTPFRTLTPGDPLYATATALLTPRCLARRAKVLPADQLVSTDDLPIYPDYLAQIQATGAQVVQMSRWLNTVMVYTDTATLARLRTLPFLDSTRTVKAHRAAPDPFGRRVSLFNQIMLTSQPAANDQGCITEAYGLAARQNHMQAIDAAHRMGIAGEGVLVGVLDAGFDWRNHNALNQLHVIGEYDFVNHDTNAADEPGEDAEGHGTAVMSMIGGLYDSTLIGAVPHASFILAKTEDVRSERNVEEDNFVAGLEWIEAMGGDVTNTSLGYTEFDPPEQPHTYAELTGHTLLPSRGLNHAVRMGMICVVAAGNEGQHSYRYIGAPAEADSSIAAAAVDSSGTVARFSSIGLMNGRTTLKPDVAALGVGNWGADHSGPDRFLTGQGTSFASPMTTGSIALILSARPSLTPWQVRDLLYRTSDHADAPDTAYGHGVVNVDRMLTSLAESAPVVGFPLVQRTSTDYLSIAAAVRYSGLISSESAATMKPTNILSLTISVPGTSHSVTTTQPQLPAGIARWYIPTKFADGYTLQASDHVVLRFDFTTSGTMIRRDTLSLNGRDFAWLAPSPASRYASRSVLCTEAAAPGTELATAVPNPFNTSTVIQYQTPSTAHVSLIVYNALGQEVETVVDDPAMAPGFHTAYFQPAGLAAGSYYYLLHAGDAVLTGALIYIP
ncbi:MAG TPA: S8 family peptidase [Candidatus Kapabacteria bacterium]|nr:S8 family peptidase [Candidatus Kapabacteria bacterium]